MTRVIVHCISRGFAGLFPVGHPRCGAGAGCYTFRFPTRYRLCHICLSAGDVAEDAIWPFEIHRIRVTYVTFANFVYSFTGSSFAASQTVLGVTLV